MDWMNWLLLAVALAATGTILYLRLKGYIAIDAATLCIGAVVELVRKAEELWKDYQGIRARVLRRRRGYWRSYRSLEINTTRPLQAP